MKRLSKSEISTLIEMSKNGTSLNNICRKFNLGKSTVYYHVKKYVKKMSKIDMEKLSEWETGYIVGLFISDGNLSFGRRNYSYKTVFSLLYFL